MPDFDSAKDFFTKFSITLQPWHYKEYTINETKISGKFAATKEHGGNIDMLSEAILAVKNRAIAFFQLPNPSQLKPLPRQQELDRLVCGTVLSHLGGSTFVGVRGGVGVCFVVLFSVLLSLGVGRVLWTGSEKNFWCLVSHFFARIF